MWTRKAKKSEKRNNGLPSKDIEGMLPELTSVLSSVRIKLGLVRCLRRRQVSVVFWLSKTEVLSTNMLFCPTGNSIPY